MAANNPANVTIKGRASFPVWTIKEALARNTTSKFPKDEDKVSPEVNMLIEQDQLDKLTTHILDEFLPYCEEQFKKGEKRNALDPKVAKRIRDLVESGDWTAQPPFLPIKQISEKNQPNAPECVASVKVSGPTGADFRLEATVFSEDQLVDPDSQVASFPVRKPLNETIFEMYPGCYIVATLNLFSFFSSNAILGISAAANTVFYMGNVEGERFGGGIEVDEDAIFMD